MKQPSCDAREAPTPVPGFLTKDPATLAVLARAVHYAASDLPVLIEGETGTGKELLARAVHDLSARRRRPWTVVQGGALPLSLQESELFGARRGAYTGAVGDREGLVEEADGGTLFLDEVGEMELPTQAKLLRFLEEGEIRRLGENRLRAVDVRVICATNRDLAERTRNGAFRADLYYRLNGAPLSVPPLHARRDDVPLLARHFVRRIERRDGVGLPCAPGLLEHLTLLPWPGNVRQLRNEIERAVLVARGERRPIAPRDFPRESGDLGTSGYGERVAAFERGLILDALQRTKGNRAQAARLLGGLKRTTLIGKIRRLGLEQPAESVAGGRPNGS